MSARDWSRPADLRAQVERYWANGRLLTDETLFPLELKLRRPVTRELSDRFEEVREWIRELEGEGAYRIEWAEVTHRVLGRNRVPARVVVERREDALAWIGRLADTARYGAMVAQARQRMPELEEWLRRRPMTALEYAADWDRILDVLEWLRTHPASRLYLRQLDIPGVDTKFIEARRALFLELAGGDLVGPRPFERRFGLATKPMLVRFRVLDPGLAIHGYTDLSVPDHELARLEVPAMRVFVTENEVNGLAFPPVAGAIVIFGLGYGLERLAAIQWLQGRDLVYWGDIDTYGFHMLDRLRVSFPRARSVMMDRATLLEHRALWVQESRSYGGELGRLTEAEAALYRELRSGAWGERVRLEQERIRFGWVERALADL